VGSSYFWTILMTSHLHVRPRKSSDKLRLLVPQGALTFTAIAFRVSTHSVWNSLSFDSRSAQLASSFRRRYATVRHRHRIHWTLWLYRMAQKSKPIFQD